MLEVNNAEKNKLDYLKWLDWYD